MPFISLNYIIYISYLIFTFVRVTHKIRIVNTVKTHRRYSMNNNNLIQATNEQDTMQSTIINEVRQKISDAAINAENTSKEKYAAKEKLIASADDMTTQEKLDAMDSNYDRRNQERWQNVLRFAAMSFGVVGIAIGSPIAVKNVRKLLSVA